MTDREKAIEECLDECTGIARQAGSSGSSAWSCVRVLHKKLLDEKAKSREKSESSVGAERQDDIRL